MGKRHCASGEGGRRVLTQHINKLGRRLITRASICQTGRQAGSTSPFSAVDSSSLVIFSSCWSWILAYAPQIKAQHMFLCRLDYTSSPDNQWQTLWHTVPEQRQRAAKNNVWVWAVEERYSEWQTKLPCLSWVGSRVHALVQPIILPGTYVAKLHLLEYWWKTELVRLFSCRVWCNSRKCVLVLNALYSESAKCVPMYTNTAKSNSQKNNCALTDTWHPQGTLHWWCSRSGVMLLAC